MTDLPPLLLSRDRVQHGLTPNELAKRVKAGGLVRVRQGVYTDGAAWKGLQPWEQYRLRVQAAAETFENPTVFARHSAASVWGIPTIGLHHPVQGRIRTVLDLAAFTPFTESAAPLDHVLRPDRSPQLSALTKDQLEADIGSNYSAAAGRRIRAAIAFADPLSGSAGESYSRSRMHVAGFEAPVLQQAIYDTDGLVGYGDFHWKQVRVVGEFDGVEKYVKPEFLNGRTASQAVVEEKKRENRIRATGTHVARWDWADLMSPASWNGS